MPIPIPASLVRHLREGRCALFVGAGLSAGAGLPDWKRLLGVLVADVESEYPSDGTGDELRKLIDAGKLLDVADHCRQRLGERRYHELLGEQLRAGSGEIPENHALITQLPFSAIVTTNYDKLLERAYTRLRGDLPKVVTARDRESLGSLLFTGGFFILKAHGDIDDPESLVLTARDYREIIHANAAFSSLFSALLMTKSILFLGYSLSDPDFRLLMDRQLSAFGENIPERYSVMSGVGPVEGDVLKRAGNIKVLAYPDGEHQEITVFLRALRERTAAVEAPAGGPEEEAEPVASGAPAPRAFVRPGPRPAPDVPGPPPPVGGLAEPARPVTAAEEARLVIAAHRDRIEVTLQSGAGPVSRLSERLPWAGFYRRLASLLEPGAGSPEAEENYRQAGKLLAELLPQTALGALPRDRVVAIEAPRDLGNVPWELAHCDGDEPLALTRPVIRAITAGAAARGLPGLRRPVRVLVIGDPGTDPIVRLPGAYQEALDISEVYSRSVAASVTVLCRDEANLDSVVSALSERAHDIVHFAGHAWFDAQESYLAFDRGEQITASELRSLLGGRPPAILFLNSHYTAFLPRGMRPPELAHHDGVRMPPTSHLGLGHVAMAAGVGAFIGCFSSPTDGAARHVGAAVHRELLGGASLVNAMRSARQETLAAHPGDVSPLQYVLAGHPHYRLPVTG